MADSRPVLVLQFWVYLFHMPAFVFVSGLFSKNAIKEKRWDKAIPYVFLYLLMKFLLFLQNHSLFRSGIKLICGLFSICITAFINSFNVPSPPQHTIKSQF